MEGVNINLSNAQGDGALFTKELPIVAIYFNNLKIHKTHCSNWCVKTGTHYNYRKSVGEVDYPFQPFIRFN